MASPVTPSDFCDLRISPTDDPCVQAEKMAQIANHLCTWFKYMVNEDRTLTDEFKGDVGVSGGTGTTGLDAPSGVTATSDRTDDVQVNWGSVAAATSYGVYRGTTSDTASMTLLASGVTVIPYLDTSAVVGTSYFYAVKAANATLISGFSAVASGKRIAGGGSFTPDDWSETGTSKTVTTPVGATLMTAQIWGPGNRGGNQAGGPDWLVAGDYRAGGGGGGSGAYVKVTGIPIVGGTDKFVLAPGAPGSPSVLTKVGSSANAVAPSGVPGNNSNYHVGGNGGAGGPAGTSTLGGTLDSASSPGAAGGAGDSSSTAGGAGGAAIMDGGRSAGRGGEGQIPPTGTVAGNGYILLTYS